ncbi:MAG: hypothetical protein GXO82_02720 [Chlorobi bacterium]|nr:hypothetical protein [Chlorobiota bacterium]
MKNVFMLSLSLLLFSCGQESGVNTANPVLNTPAVGNTPNSFGYSLNANAFTVEDFYTLSFSSDSLSIGITVTGYVSGEGMVEILGEADSVIYSMSLNRNIALGETTLHGLTPQRVHLVFNKYSGSVAVAVSGK